MKPFRVWIIATRGVPRMRRKAGDPGLEDVTPLGSKASAKGMRTRRILHLVKISGMDENPYEAPLLHEQRQRDESHETLWQLVWPTLLGLAIVAVMVVTMGAVLTVLARKQMAERKAKARTAIQTETWQRNGGSQTG
jgi:hypothetical protein